MIQQVNPGHDVHALLPLYPEVWLRPMNGVGKEHGVRWWWRSIVDLALVFHPKGGCIYAYVDDLLVAAPEAGYQEICDSLGGDPRLEGLDGTPVS